MRSIDAARDRFASGISINSSFKARGKRRAYSCQPSLTHAGMRVPTAATISRIRVQAERVAALRRCLLASQSFSRL